MNFTFLETFPSESENTICCKREEEKATQEKKEFEAETPDFIEMETVQGLPVEESYSYLVEERKVSALFQAEGKSEILKNDEKEGASCQGFVMPTEFITNPVSPKKEESNLQINEPDSVRDQKVEESLESTTVLPDVDTVKPVSKKMSVKNKTFATRLRNFWLNAFGKIKTSHNKKHQF